MDLNKVMLIGRLTRDPELKSLSSGRSVASASIATGRQWKDQNGQVQKQSEFHNVVIWGKMAETASQYLKKGSRIYVEGRLQTRDWTGTDGVKRYRTEIIAENFIMLDSKGFGGAAPTAPNSHDDYSGPKEVVEDEIKVEDIPF
jgi:single-strand DNA-binding protein